MNRPESWRIKSISDLGGSGAVQTGPFGAELHAEDYVASGVPLVLIRNIGDGEVREEGLPLISRRDAKRLSTYALEADDIVFSRVGRVGSCFLASERHAGWIISGQLLRVRIPDGVIDKRFLLHQLLSEPIQNAINDRSVGTTRQSINTSILEQLEVWLPSTVEQSSIAAILDTIDEAMRSTERIIEKLGHVKQGLLHDLLTRGVDGDGELRDPISKPEVFRAVGDLTIPEGWVTCELDSVVDPQRPVVYGILMPGYGFPGGVPVVKVKNIKEGRINEDDLLLTNPRIDTEYRRSRVREGDLLFSIRGTVGRMAFVPRMLDGANITQDTARIAITGANARFVAHYLQTPLALTFVELHTLGQAVRGINLRDVRRIPLILPPRSEQDALADVLDSVDAKVQAESQQLGKLRALKDGLMGDLLTGRVRVTLDAEART